MSNHLEIARRIRSKPHTGIHQEGNLPSPVPDTREIAFCAARARYPSASAGKEIAAQGIYLPAGDPQAIQEVPLLIPILAVVQIAFRSIGQRPPGRMKCHQRPAAEFA